MSLNKVVIGAPTSMVFGILVDPTAYPYWVMGTRAIRGWDCLWPAPGSCLHHRAGIGPLVVEDSSEVLAIEQDRRLTLEVRVGWLGEGVVDVRLEPAGIDRVTVTLVETSTGGFLNNIPPPLLEPLLHARNALSLRRLARLSTSRQTLLHDHPNTVAVGSG